MVPLFVGVGLLLVAVILVFNALVAKKNAVANAFATIDAYLKKRHDLIPNLVEAVKGAMTYERGVLTQLTEMRAQVLSGRLSAGATVDAENRITTAIGGVLASVENYPALRANENVVKLQGSLNDIEEQIAAARRAYNAAVTDYNNAIEMFPTNLAASAMGYARQPLLTAPPAEREPIAVGPLSGNR